MKNLPMRILTTLAVLAIGGFGTRCVAAPDIAIYAKAFNGYERVRLPDGSFKPESYVFAPGNRRTPIGDPSLEKLPFVEVARAIAEPLRQRGYVPSFDPKHTDLLIFVYWGMSSGAKSVDGTPVISSASDDDSLSGINAAANQIRDQNNAQNAALLGYRENLQRAWETPGFSILQDAVDELEMDRYYVVLVAVDYPALRQKKGYQLRWDARFSVPAQGHAFDDELPKMAQAASRYFGDNLDKLIRRPVPEGTVEIGTPKVIENVPRK
jgi:hypothetical protein